MPESVLRDYPVVAPPDAEKTPNQKDEDPKSCLILLLLYPYPDDEITFDFTGTREGGFELKFACVLVIDTLLRLQRMVYLLQGWLVIPAAQLATQNTLPFGI